MALNVLGSGKRLYVMVIRRGSVVVVLLVAVALNLWLLSSDEFGGVAAGISFSLVCLCASWALASLKRTDELQGIKRAEVSVAATSLPASRSHTFPNPMLNAFTIDLEDYYHTEVSSRAVKYSDWDKMPSRIESSVHRLLDLLDETDTRATVFVLGWLAKKRPGLIREVARRGHELGCHSFQHRRVNRLKPAAFLEDTRVAKEIIEDVTGMAVEGYRAPSFSITPGTEWAFKILEQLGFSYDSSVHPVWHVSYANTRAPRFPYYLDGTNVLEIPIATWRAWGTNLPVGGGAYLRLLPYWYVRHGLSVVNQREWQPVTLYVHPWEIDYLQPAIHTGWGSHVRQTWGTRAMETKLGRLLGGMRFGPIAEAYARNLSANPAAFTRATQQAPSLAQVS